MLNKLAAIALAAFSGTPLTATAIPITYQITFTALSGTVTRPVSSDPLTPPMTRFEDAAGKTWFGLFAVDDEILLTDGVKGGNLSFFFIQMEDYIWGYNLPANNALRGFRGPAPGGQCPPYCSFAPSPGFEVVNGAITNLYGGVYGISDNPFVDFSSVGPNTFTVQASRGTNTVNVFATGTMEIFRVPEPGALSLLAVGLLVLAWPIRRSFPR